jgi:hypothetical protein
LERALYGKPKGNKTPQEEEKYKGVRLIEAEPRAHEGGETS